jgi:hypothetical protein
MTPKDLERSWVSSKDWRRNLVSSADILASDLAGRRVAHRAAFIDRANVRLGLFVSILACSRHVRLVGNLGSGGYPVLPVEGIGLDVIQAPNRGLESCGMN